MRQIPAPLLFVVSGISQYVGAGTAVGLFDRAPAASVGWARILLAAVILGVWGRPWRVQWTRRSLMVTGIFGVVLAAMNLAFYAALQYLPLGNVVALEFLGPVAVAALTGHGVRERIAISLALGGVALLAGVTLTSGTDGAVLGLVFALLAGALWGCYILLGQRVSGQSSGLGPLAVAMATGALVFAPFVGAASAPLFSGWGVFAATAGVAFASSVVPYGLDQVILRRLRPAQFAILLAILPVAALAVGMVVLRQIPNGWELVGLVFVCVAIALTNRESDPASDPA